MTTNRDREIDRVQEELGFRRRRASSLVDAHRSGRMASALDPVSAYVYEQLFFDRYGVRPGALEDAVRAGRRAVASGATDLDLVALMRDLKQLAYLSMLRADVAQIWALVDEAITLAERLPTPLAKAAGLYREARNAEKGCNWVAAEAAYHQAQGVAENAGEDLVAAFVLGDLSRLYSCTSAVRPELDYARRALARYRKLGAASADDALREMGRRLEQGGPSAALDWSRRALGIFSTMNTRAFGIYPPLGYRAAVGHGALVMAYGPQPELVAEMARLRVARGEGQGPLVTRICDLPPGRDIERRFDDDEADNVPLTE